MKTCFKCGVEKPLTDFYKHPGMSDGRLNKCKECNKRDVRENRAAKADYYRKYDADRFQNDPKVKARHKRYQQTEAGKASMNASNVKWSRANKEKRAAHFLVNNAVRDGRLHKPDKCSSCGATGRIEGHHEDYCKPLEVVWLCPQCHTDVHKL